MAIMSFLYENRESLAELLSHRPFVLKDMSFLPTVADNEEVFHKFAALPADIQNIIFQLSIDTSEGRDISLRGRTKSEGGRKKNGQKWNYSKAWNSDATIPALHVCRRSRDLAIKRWKLGTMKSDDKGVWRQNRKFYVDLAKDTFVFKEGVEDLPLKGFIIGVHPSIKLQHTTMKFAVGPLLAAGPNQRASRLGRDFAEKLALEFFNLQKVVLLGSKKTICQDLERPSSEERARVLWCEMQHRNQYMRALEAEFKAWMSRWLCEQKSSLVIRYEEHENKGRWDSFSIGGQTYSL